MVSRGRVFKIVVNHEEQYKAIPEGQQPAPGWREEAVRGSRGEIQRWLGERRLGEILFEDDDLELIEDMDTDPVQRADDAGAGHRG